MNPQHAARIAGAVHRILRTCAGLDDVDARRKLVDDAGKLLEVAGELLRQAPEPGDGSRLVAVLLRELAEDHRTQSAQVEGALRERSHRLTPLTVG